MTVKYVEGVDYHEACCGVGMVWPVDGCDFGQRDIEYDAALLDDARALVLAGTRVKLSCNWYLNSSIWSRCESCNGHGTSTTR